jgi:hypothetical protein
MFYELTEDLQIADRWLLGEARWPLSLVQLFGAFCEGRRVDEKALPNEQIELRWVKEGNRLDFTFTAMGTPIVSERAADVLGTIAQAEIQCIPVQIPTVNEQYFILNLTRRVD